MPDAMVIEMYKAAFIMRGTTVLKGGVKAVKNGITIPNRRNNFQLPFKQSALARFLYVYAYILTSSN